MQYKGSPKRLESTSPHIALCPRRLQNYKYREGDLHRTTVPTHYTLQQSSQSLIHSFTTASLSSDSIRSGAPPCNGISSPATLSSQSRVAILSPTPLQPRFLHMHSHEHATTDSSHEYFDQYGFPVRHLLPSFVDFLA